MKKTKPKAVQIRTVIVRVDEDLHKKLRAEANARRVSLSWLVRETLFKRYEVNEDYASR